MFTVEALVAAVRGVALPRSAGRIPMLVRRTIANYTIW